MNATRPLQGGTKGCEERNGTDRTGPDRTPPGLPGPAPTEHSRQDVGAEEVPVLPEAVVGIHVRRWL